MASLLKEEKKTLTKPAGEEEELREFEAKKIEGRRLGTKETRGREATGSSTESRLTEEEKEVALSGGIRRRRK